jgi:hypothetical protein
VQQPSLMYSMVSEVARYWCCPSVEALRVGEGGGGSLAGCALRTAVRASKNEDRVRAGCHETCASRLILPHM